MVAAALAQSYFSVTVQPSGRNFTVPNGDTVLAAGIQQGIGLPYGCKDGACGSCKCKMLSGSVVHGNHQSKALSPEEEGHGYVLTCCALPQSDLVLESRQVTQAGALPIKKMPTRVSSMRKASDDVMVIKLQLPANDTFTYRAGQYVEFILRDGARRSYSMANAPHMGPGIELHIRHMPGGKFTDHVFGAMKEKEMLRVEGPFGSFFLHEDSDKPIILLASGTGFAPVKALIEHMQHQGIARKTVLYWGGRNPSDLYMQDWVQTQLAVMPTLSFVPVVSETQESGAWSGRTGFVHRAVMQDFPDMRGYEVYACGAPVVVESARIDFVVQCGLAADDFFADAFTSEADKVQP
ncbi:MAG: CDP-6-deoxy-delta-3,4-glucoseen reductase [Candidatus Saccharibacteria bacterium]|nr:CDP-6-deoxy-delta-3,4-glucoseen reductase [Rhodoferax sp.]